MFVCWMYYVHFWAVCHLQLIVEDLTWYAIFPLIKILFAVMKIGTVEKANTLKKSVNYLASRNCTYYGMKWEKINVI